MHNTAVLAAAMSGTVGLGGIMGFVKKGSKISLVAGSLVAAGYGYVAYSINQDSSNASVEQNSMIGVGLSVLLAIGMGMRYRKVVVKEGKPGTVPLAVALLGLAAAAGFYGLK